VYLIVDKFEIECLLGHIKMHVTFYSYGDGPIMSFNGCPHSYLYLGMV